MSKKRKDKKRKVKLSKTAKDLLVLSSLDEATAWIPTDVDHVAEYVPRWCELVLEIKRSQDGTPAGEWPLSQRIPLRRHDGEMIIEVLDDVLHPTRAAGPADKLWLALDDVIERIMGRVNKDKSPRDEDKGEAVGLTKALAVLVSPFNPDEDAIKDIAMERYAIRNRLK